ncbi:3-deoxy-manno-octulosonate cytidylyltransferase [Pantoea sp. CCBC3-3-1]|uniref:3-deoxy-manno-octulosonate cytidylyltransferase n=1 Tax=Pantoea sp. CCBC3-3-1 TaxID=2490851 RepID=UPI0011BF0117|nr:3-deoxy-manno-octulosonate cytidylyltransferase [Pantoea sp. CCBC3-3-1]
MSYTLNPPFTVVIPARYGSTRLPAKALININGRPMITHTIQRAKESGANAVIVATDHKDILDLAVRQGVGAVMTSDSCASGTDRIAEAVSLLSIDPDTIIINLQGDEPMFPGVHLSELADTFAYSGSEMATIGVEGLTAAQLADPNVVKVVTDNFDSALYFSRAGVPFSRDGQLVDDSSMRRYFMRHVGVYAYRAGFVQDFVNWGVSLLEFAEKLEQLRVLANGCRIQMLRLKDLAAHGVDTPKDLALVRSLLM